MECQWFRYETKLSLSSAFYSFLIWPLLPAYRRLLLHLITLSDTRARGGTPLDEGLARPPVLLAIFQLLGRQWLLIVVCSVWITMLLTLSEILQIGFYLHWLYYKFRRNTLEVTVINNIIFRGCAIYNRNVVPCLWEYWRHTVAAVVLLGWCWAPAACLHTWSWVLAVGGVGPADRVVMGVNQFVRVSRISWPIWVKFGVEKRHVMLLQFRVFTVQPKRRNMYTVQHNVLNDSGLMWERHVKMIRYDMIILVNCSWVDTRWQYTFTHKQYTEHNETECIEQNIHNNKNT